MKTRKFTYNNFKIYDEELLMLIYKEKLNSIQIYQEKDPIIFQKSLALIKSFNCTFEPSSKTWRTGKVFDIEAFREDCADQNLLLKIEPIPSLPPPPPASSDLPADPTRPALSDSDPVCSKKDSASVPSNIKEKTLLEILLDDISALRQRSENSKNRSDIKKVLSTYQDIEKRLNAYRLLVEATLSEAEDNLEEISRNIFKNLT